MATLASLVKVAKELGYDLWYDRSQRLWTCTHERYETEYYPPSIFAKLTADSLRNSLKLNIKED